MKLRSLSITAGAVALLAFTGTSAFSSVKVGDHLPAETHFAFWVDDLTKAGEQAASNRFLNTMLGEGGVLGKGVDGIPRLVAGLPVSSADPLSPMWNEILPIFGFTLHGSMDSATSVFHIDPEDVTETFSNSLAIYSTMLRYFTEGNLPVVEWDVILAADYDPEDEEKVNRFLEKALSRVPDNANKRTVSYSGRDVFQITYYIDEQASLPGDPDLMLSDMLVQEIPIIIEYTLADGVFLLAEGRGEPLRRALRALEREEASFRLSSKPGYRRGRELLGAGDGFHLYVDLPHHVSQWRNWPSEAGTAEIMAQLGFARSGPVMIRATADEDHVRLDAAAISSGEPAGIFRLLANTPDNSMENIALVPSDARAFGSVSIDVEALFNMVQRIFAGQGGPGAIFMLAMKNLEALSGVALERDILPGSRGELISYLRPGDTGTEATRGTVSGAFLIPMSGSADTISSFNRMIRQLSSEQTMILDVEATDMEGVSLWETPPSPVQRGQGGLYFAATPKGLVIASNGAELRQLVRRIVTDPDDSIRSNATAREFLDSLPGEGLRGFAFMPKEAIEADIDQQAQRTAGIPSAPTADQRRQLKDSLGGVSWILRAGHDHFRLTYTLQAGE